MGVDIIMIKAILVQLELSLTIKSISIVFILLVECTFKFLNYRTDIGIQMDCQILNLLI